MLQQKVRPSGNSSGKTGGRVSSSSPVIRSPDKTLAFPLIKASVAKVTAQPARHSPASLGRASRAENRVSTSTHLGTSQRLGIERTADSGMMTLVEALGLAEVVERGQPGSLPAATKTDLPRTTISGTFLATAAAEGAQHLGLKMMVDHLCLVMVVATTGKEGGDPPHSSGEADRQMLSPLTVGRVRGEADGMATVVRVSPERWRGRIEEPPSGEARALTTAIGKITAAGM